MSIEIPPEQPEVPPETAVLITDRGPAGYERPDMLILDDIARQLATDPNLEAADLRVACHEAKVIVTGSVPRPEDQRRLEAIVVTTFGVTDADLTALEVRRDLDPPDPEDLRTQSAGTSHEDLQVLSPADEPEAPDKQGGGDDD
jgi:hypothetical protein